MPIAPPFPAQPAHNALFPALYLYPLNDTWAPKHIALTAAHTKIGRQTSSKTAPGERNGFFDSKVLSRQHAEVWEENGKIFIKDVKSSNGTFINGERLSSEGHESEPFELKSDDIVEFGIDIVGEDNKTIIHHKVAARVVCVFSEQEATVAARAEQHQAAAAAQHAAAQQQHLGLSPHQQQQHLHHQQQQQQQQQQLGGQMHNGMVMQGQGHHGYLSSPNGLGIGGGANASFPFSSPSTQGSNPNGAAPQRRSLAHNGVGVGGLGGMGAPPSLARAPGKSGTGLSFDVILSRLQGEVQKSRETGAELGGLQVAMGEVEGVLGGRAAPNLPPFPTHLPPVRPPVEAAPQPPPSGPVPAPPNATASTTSGSPSIEQGVPSSLNGATGTTTSPPDGASSTSAEPSSSSVAGQAQAVSVSALQAQLTETQANLAAHLERMRALEDVLKEQEAIKREVGVLRGLVERRDGSLDQLSDHRADQQQRSDQGQQQQERHQYESEELSLLERPSNEREMTLGLEDVMEDDDEDRDEEEGEDDEEDDDEDDRRSVNTVMPHELERVEEEDEDVEEEGYRPASVSTSSSSTFREHEEGEGEQSAFEHEHERDDHEREREEREETQQEREEVERRRAEDLGVGRPRTPEPSLLGLSLGMGMGMRERRSGGSPLSASSLAGGVIRGEREREVVSPTPASSGSTSNTTTTTVASNTSSTSANTEDVHAQVERLASQVGAVLALTSALERQHENAQGTIRELEEKVRSLEGLLEEKKTKAAVASDATTDATTDEHLKKDTEATTEKDRDHSGSDTSADSDVTLLNDTEDTKDTEPPSALAAWTRSIAGQWTTLQADWARERATLLKAREEWDARVVRLDDGLTSLESGLSKLDEGVVRLDTGLSKVDSALSRVDGGLAKVDGVQSSIVGLLAAQERMREAVWEQGGRLEAHLAAYQASAAADGTGTGAAWAGVNGDAKQRLNGGLVTPPSPRSQSSDSRGYRRRRRRSSGSRPRRGEGSPSRRSGDESEGDDQDQEEGKHGIARALGIAAATATSAAVGNLATPASSVYGLPGERVKTEPLADTGLSTADDLAQSSSSTMDIKTESAANGVLTAPATRANSSSLPEADTIGGSLDEILKNAERALEERTEEMQLAKKQGGARTQQQINVQAAIGVLLLSVAAAAVFWKVKPE